MRLHHGHRGRNGNYSATELEAWARRVEAWRARAEVLLYLNNDWSGYAVRNARWLARRLSAGGGADGAAGGPPRGGRSPGGGGG